MLIENFLDLTNYATDTRVARCKTEKKTGVKKWNYAIMNPPYAGNLH